LTKTGNDLILLWWFGMEKRDPFGLDVFVEDDERGHPYGVQPRLVRKGEVEKKPVHNY